MQRIGNRSMKIYIAWVHDWPQEMLIFSNMEFEEQQHDRQNLCYKYQAQKGAWCEYIRDEQLVKDVVNFFLLLPDTQVEIKI
jgi:hypothetical protein